MTTSLHLIANLLFIFISSSLTLCCQGAYIVTVDPRDEECLGIRGSRNKKSTLYGDWEQIEDVTARPLRVSVTTDSDDYKYLHQSRKGQKYGTFSVDLEPKQKVFVCIQNGIATKSSNSNNHNDDNAHTNKADKKDRSAAGRGDDLTRSVGFDIQVEEKSIHEELEESYSGILNQATSLSRELSRLRNHQEYMRSREAKHREVVEQTFSKLLGYVLAQCSGVIFLAVAQVMYLRRFLERRRYV